MGSKKAAETVSSEIYNSYQSLFEQAAYGIILLSPNGTVTNCNAQAAEVFGLPKKELIGKSVSTLIAQEQREETLLKIEKLKRGRQIRPYESIAVRKDKRLVPVEIGMAGVYDQQGELSMIQCFIHDISPRKQLEQQLSQAQRMESLGLLAGGIAHDFNNILGGILGYATYAQTIIEKHHSAQKALSTIIEAAKRASDLTQQLLSFAKEEGTRHEPLDLNQLVRKTVDLFSRSIAKPINISLKLHPNLFCIKASRAQVQQVLLNILANARDAMPEGGKIKITTQNVSAAKVHREVPTLKPKRNYVKVSISDTGKGFPQELANHIFEPFFTTKSDRGSTGMGLSIAYNIMQRHGGHVSVEAKPGSGATFHLYFPAESAKKADTRPPKRQAPGGKELILVVDDEEMIVSLATDVLQNAGYRVLTASSAKKALEVFKQHVSKIDLVLIDVVMPGMSGCELLGQMRAIRPDLKAVISSGYARGSEEIGPVDLRSEFFIQKPYEVNELLSIIRKALDDKRHAETDCTRSI